MGADCLALAHGPEHTLLIPGILRLARVLVELEGDFCFCIAFDRLFGLEGWIAAFALVCFSIRRLCDGVISVYESPLRILQTPTFGRFRLQSERGPFAVSS